MTTVHAGRIHGWPGAGSIRLEGSRIAEITARTDPGVGVQADRQILPGLRDSHLHPAGLAVAGQQLDVSEQRSLREIRDAIAGRSAELDARLTLVATGLDEERLAEGRLPTRWDLDRAADDRPVLVYRQCSHVAVANSAALRTAGVGDDTADPTGGRLVRDGGGRLTGILEESAIGLVSGQLAAGTADPDARTVSAVLHRLRRLGVVAVDAMVSAGPSMWCTGHDELAVIASLGDSSPIRMDVFVIADRTQDLRAAAASLGSAGPQVRFAGWKGFADGALGGRTAALRHPYADDPTTSGLDCFSGSHFSSMTATALELGGTAAIHAIGDLALERALSLAEQFGPGTVRVEHASVADPDQIGRMAAAGVIASIQPSFVASDGAWIGRRLGSDRTSWAYPFRSMHAAGVTLRGGSDAPIESPDPLIGIRDATGERDEALGFEVAVDMYAAAPLVAGGPATFVVAEGGSDEHGGMAVTEVWIDGRRME